ncbi:MAG: putative ABC transporter permease [Clostridiales bacterium]|nr:putative ABC transporter permease [Clostridiales bacterium]
MSRETVNNDQINKFTLLMTYMIEFTAGSLWGWLYEEGLELIVNHAYSDRGLLHMPLIPIYGFGCLLLLLLYRGKEYSAPFIFISSAVLTTLLELIASYPLKKILGYLPWYYGAWPLNYEGRISLFSSLLFGLLAAVFMKLIHPQCRRLEKAPPAVVNTLGIVFLLAFLTDTAFTFARI